MEIRFNKKPITLSAPTRDDIMNLICEMKEYEDKNYVVAFNIAKIRAKKSRTATSYHTTTKTSYTANVYVFEIGFIDTTNVNIYQYDSYFDIGYIKPSKNCIVNQKYKYETDGKMSGFTSVVEI